MASTNLSGSIFTDEVDLYVRRGGSISPPYSVIYANEFWISFDSSKEIISNWCKTKDSFLNIQKDDMISVDSNENFWVVLNQEISFTQKAGSEIDGFDIPEQRVFRYLQGYFIKNCDRAKAEEQLELENFYGRWFPEGIDSPTIFNREFYWSPATKSIIKDEWKRYEKEERIPINKQKNIKTSKLAEFIPEIGSYDIKTTLISNVLPVANRYCWESNLDNTNKETYFDIPCSEIISQFSLAQNKLDGYFYDGDTLVAFDTNLVGINKGLVIRKDYLDLFLKENNYSLFWTAIAQKGYFDTHDNSVHNEYSGLIEYTIDNISGDLGTQKFMPHK
jgi:hypothetical protein